jgi:hypothetical protein
MKTLIMPNYQRVTVWEAEIRATKGDAIVDAAFRKAGLAGNESPTMVKTFHAKWNALRELDPSIMLPRQTREAIQSIGGAQAKSPGLPLPVSPPRPSQSAPTRPAPQARPVIDANLHGLDRVRASICAEMQAGTHGLQPLAAENDAWKLPASLASIAPVGHTIARLDVDQLGALACEVFGEVQTNRLVATSNSDAQTLNRLERQFFIENLTIPGQTDNAFNASLRMTNQTTGLAGVAHRRQQGKIDSFVAFLESES